MTKTRPPERSVYVSRKISHLQSIKFLSILRNRKRSRLPKDFRPIRTKRAQTWGIYKGAEPPLYAFSSLHFFDARQRSEEKTITVRTPCSHKQTPPSHQYPLLNQKTRYHRRAEMIDAHPAKLREHPQLPIDLRGQRQQNRPTDRTRRVRNRPSDLQLVQGRRRR